MAPTASGDHGFQEAKCEHCPLCAFNVKVRDIGAFNVEVRDIGAKLFDVERRG